MIIESNIRTLVLFDLLNLLPKSDKMLSKPRILSLFPNSFDEGALVIRRIFFLVDMITKPKFSNCHYVFKIGLFR